ncbi:3-hydroxyacyl-ACP dehydratase [Sphingobacterium deserti]|uniref:Dehydratase n=1 Tax=Sphingobacterium deserti TaxID=1229276 RepID=A0A0B8T206_9SPHI|nr:3-hydroxyacyl-ACP dehydratase [Sphingobacterium deserti]KGE14836.1 dehydratase [Sphingobacterium deserti]
MSLLQGFYEIEQFVEQEAGKHVASVRLNPHHAIFQGHFPGNPVTPGVCMMHIIKELSEHIVNRPLFLSKSSNVKFMALINPEHNPLLRLELDLSEGDDGTLKVKNVTTFGDTVALKLTNVYRNKEA